MPTYDVRNTKTGEVETILCKYTELEELISKGEYEKVVSAPMIVGAVGSLVGKIDNGFNDVLQKVKSNHHGSNIETK